MATSNHIHDCCEFADLYRSIEGERNIRTVAATVDGIPCWVKLPTRILNYIGAEPRKAKLSQAIRTALPSAVDPLQPHTPEWSHKAPVSAEQCLADEMRDTVDRAAIERLKRQHCGTSLTVMDEAHHVKRKGALKRFDLSTLDPHTKVQFLRDPDA